MNVVEILSTIRDRARSEPSGLSFLKLRLGKTAQRIRHFAQDLLVRASGALIQASEAASAIVHVTKKPDEP